MSENKLIAFIYNSQVPETKLKSEEIIRSLGLEKNSWLSSAGNLSDNTDKLNSTYLVVVVGGDGTILRSVRVISPFELPVVGIKMGKVGFMAELSPEEAVSSLPKYINYESSPNNGIRTERRMMIQADVIPTKGGTPRLSIHALNDITVGSRKVSRLVELEASVNHVHLTNYRADAVIVSTATGSTGYALSAGGPIVFPEAQMMILQPVAAHTGLRDALVLDPTSTVSLEASESYLASISADGFVDSEVQPGEKVIVTRRPYDARFLRSEKPDFFYTALNMRLGLAYRSQRPPEGPLE